MSKIRQLLRLHAQGESKMQISILLSISRNTLRKYLDRFIRLRLTMDQVEGMNDATLDHLFVTAITPEPSERYMQLHSLFPAMEKSLSKRGITRRKLWEKYLEQYHGGYQFSQYKRHLRQWLQYSKPSMRIEHKVGDKVYIDFAGDKLSIVDKETGEITYVEIFVSILGASQYTYVEAVMSQKKEDLIQCCENAFLYYGGVPRAIVPDNLRSAVTKSDRYEPTINEAFENFAYHYNTTVLPARAYRPKDKALVENAVKLIYRHIYPEIREKTFHTLEEMNKAIREALEAYNVKRLTSRPYGRKHWFEELEKEALQPLPALRYEMKRQQIVTASISCYVCLREDKHYYSIPHTYVGRKVKILYTQNNVEIFHKYTCIAVHERDRRPFHYTKVLEHLPPHHRFATEWDPEKIIGRASSIDAIVEEYIAKVIEVKQHPDQATKACQGILSMESKVGKERLVEACRRASGYGNYSYGIIKNILENSYDRCVETEPEPQLVIPEHENIRGEAYYQ